jgi:hypothetical protein
MTLDPRYDIGRSGMPAWAKRDHGPMNTYVPGPLPSQPLESSYHAGTRLVASAVVFVAIITFVLVNSKTGVLGSVLILIGLWALYAVPVWFRGRVGLRVDGSRAELHGLFRQTAFDGADVAKVQYVFAGRSPDVRLVLRDGRKALLVASRLEKGHSTLYEWLRRYAPQAEYDKRALDLRDTLVNRGLMGAPGDPWDEAGRFGPPAVHTTEEPFRDAMATPIPAKPVGEAGVTPVSEWRFGGVDRRHEGSSSPTIDTPSTEGTVSDTEPSETMKTSQPPEAKAPDSPETRTDDDEQA